MVCQRDSRRQSGVRTDRPEDGGMWMMMMMMTHCIGDDDRVVWVVVQTATTTRKDLLLLLPTDHKDDSVSDPRVIVVVKRLRGSRERHFLLLLLLCTAATPVRGCVARTERVGTDFESSFRHCDYSGGVPSISYHHHSYHHHSYCSPVASFEGTNGLQYYYTDESVAVTVRSWSW